MPNITKNQAENLAKLEKITAKMWEVVDLCNRAGYKLSFEEIRELQTIQTLTNSALDLGTR